MLIFSYSLAWFPLLFNVFFVVCPYIVFSFLFLFHVNFPLMLAFNCSGVQYDFFLSVYFSFCLFLLFPYFILKDNEFITRKIVTVMLWYFYIFFFIITVAFAIFLLFTFFLFLVYFFFFISFHGGSWENVLTILSFHWVRMRFIQAM